MELDKKINLFRRKKEILKDNKEYMSLIEEFTPYLLKLYDLQDEELKKKGWLLLEKERENEQMYDAHKIKLLELFWDSIIFK